MEIKTVIANNIAELRKSRSWTQAELAGRLNYSDKAVSKWERAESLPDITVLKKIAELFFVTVDYLLEEEHNKEQAGDIFLPKQKKKNQIIITSLSALLVFFISTIVFVVLGLCSVKLPIWMVYIYSLPVLFIVLIVFNSIWGRRIWNFVFVSMLFWSILLALYLSFLADNIWLIFIIGIPAQIIILLWGKLKFLHK